MTPPIAPLAPMGGSFESCALSRCGADAAAVDPHLRLGDVYRDVEGAEDVAERGDGGLDLRPVFGLRAAFT